MTLEAGAEQRENKSDGMSPPIDLVFLRGFTLGHLQLEKEIFDLFLAEVPKLISDFESALTEKEWRGATHTLKGTARSLGAWKLANLASSLEERSKLLTDKTFKKKGVELLLRETENIKRFLQTL